MGFPTATPKPSQRLRKRRFGFLKFSKGTYETVSTSAPYVLQGLVVALSVIAGVVDSFITRVVTIVLIFIFTGLAGLLFAKRNKSISGLLEENDQLDLKLSKSRDALRKLLKISCEDADLWGEEIRATAYVFDGVSLIPLIRVSKNPRLEQSGRSQYPPNIGYIAEAWEKGTCFMQSKHEESSRKILKKDGLTDEEIESITLHPRSFAGFRTDNETGKATGIIFIEAEKSNLINGKAMTHFQKSPNYTIFEHWLNSMHEIYSSKASLETNLPNS